MLTGLSPSLSPQTFGSASYANQWESVWGPLFSAPRPPVRAPVGVSMVHASDVDHFLVDSADFAATHGGQVDGTLFIDVDGCR